MDCVQLEYLIRAGSGASGQTNVDGKLMRATDEVVVIFKLKVEAS